MELHTIPFFAFLSERAHLANYGVDDVTQLFSLALLSLSLPPCGDEIRIHAKYREAKYLETRASKQQAFPVKKLKKNPIKVSKSNDNGNNNERKIRGLRRS